MSEEQRMEETPAAAESATDDAPAEEPATEDVQEAPQTEPTGEEDDEELTVDLDALPKMKVSELKNILKVLDLPTSGIKNVLIDRIQEHFAHEDEQEQTDEQKEAAEEDELFLPLKDENGDKKDKENTSEETKTEDDKPELTDEEKAKARAVKFNVKSDEEKKEERAAKFGVPTEKSEEAKKEERAAKFGITTSQSAQDKKKARAERFGVENKGNGTTTPKTISANVPIDQEKLKKRAARFNMDDTPPAKTCKYDIQQVMKDKVASGETIVSLNSGSLTPDERRKMRALKFGA